MVFDTITPRWYTEMLAAQDRVHEHSSSYSTPLLAMWGTKDVLVSIPDIERFVKSYGAEVESKSWAGLYHEIMNEPQQDEVFTTLLNWLDGHID